RSRIVRSICTTRTRKPNSHRVLFPPQPGSDISRCTLPKSPSSLPPWQLCPTAQLWSFGWPQFPCFFHLIVWGQTSAIALACFTAGFFLLRDDLRDQRPFLAGLAFGCLIFKPQLGIAAAFIFLYTRAWRVIAGG